MSSSTTLGEFSTHSREHTASPTSISTLKREGSPSTEITKAKLQCRDKRHSISFQLNQANADNDSDINPDVSTIQSGATTAGNQDLELPDSQESNSSSQTTEESTNANNSTTIKQDLFYLHGNPICAELRDMILDPLLALLPGIRPPPLLEVRSLGDQARLLDRYREINYVVRKATHEKFRKLVFDKEINLIQHLTLVYDEKERTDSLSPGVINFFRNDKTKLKNKYRTLTFDLSNHSCEITRDLSPEGFADQAQALSNASLAGLDKNQKLSGVGRTTDLKNITGVEKITFVFSKPPTWFEARLRLEMNNLFGFGPKCVPDTASGRDLHVLVWEGGKDQMRPKCWLSWTGINDYCEHGSAAKETMLDFRRNMAFESVF